MLVNAQDAQIVGREPVITLWGQNVSTKPYEEKFYPGLEHVLASTTPNLRRVRAQGQHRSGSVDRHVIDVVWNDQSIDSHQCQWARLRISRSQ